MLKSMRVPDIEVYMHKERLPFYQSLIIEKIPFLLSLQDREEMSPTYGSFDRTYWQWKFIDFPCARFQEALLALSYVYLCNFKGNIYYHNLKLLKWIEAGFLFWNKIQHKDGSFDEAYPYEKSFVATGFALFYLTEAFLLVHNYLEEKIKNKILLAFEKTANWLEKNDETHAFISNHRLGACAGLFNLSYILQKKKYEDQCWDLWRTVKKSQSVDGWFNEYGGADPGYLTQAIYYAAVLYERSKNQEVFKSVGENLEFIKYFIHPDGTIGGEYGSRNTEFYFSGGFEILARYFPIAEAICRRMATSLKEKNIPSTYSVDVYNMIPLLNSIATSCIFFSPNSKTGLFPYEETEFIKKFEDFKIYVKRFRNFYVIIGLTKGGVVKVFDIRGQKLLYSASGIFGKIDNKVLTSQAFHRDNIDIKVCEDRILIEAPIVFINHSVLSPLRMLIFRCLSYFMRFTKLGRKILKKYIVYYLVFKNTKSNGKFKRIISFDYNKGVKVSTEVAGLEGYNFTEEDIHTSYHMGSSRYFKINELKKKE